MSHRFCRRGGEFCLLNRRRQRFQEIGWRVKPSFQIKLHAKDKPVLVEIHKSLGVGKIYYAGPDAVKYSVFTLTDLETVINHFDKYPLITKKRADYILFKRVLVLMKRKEHLTPEGLRKFVALRASMNLGLSDKLKTAFPSVVPVERPIGMLPKTIDPN